MEWIGISSIGNFNGKGLSGRNGRVERMASLAAKGELALNWHNSVRYYEGADKWNMDEKMKQKRLTDLVNVCLFWPIE